MATLVVPPLDDEPWPTLGPQVADFLEERSVYGPGSLHGQNYVVDDEFRAQLYAAYEVYPKGHPWAGRRRYKRVVWSVRKGLAKTEKMAQVAFAELHPEGPVRCDGFDRWGRPVGRPVVDPYIPLLAVTVEQVEELAYGALYYLCTEGPDADMFDPTLERIIRLGPNGQADGKCVPLSNSPGARDGARTSFQGFDEPHRLFLPRQVQAHETMVANLEKRVLEDPWGLYVGTAGELGQGSIAEGLMSEAEAIKRGDIDEPQLFYFHRDAGQVHDSSEGGTGHDLSTLEGRLAAIKEATGPIGEYGPGQFHSIAKQWDRPAADKRYLQRVWLNLWVKSGDQAFDPKRWTSLRHEGEIPKGNPVVGGFDGARYRDATAIVLTDLTTGLQQPWGVWERPLEAEDWEVPEDEVTLAWEEALKRFNLRKVYADPPHWTETLGSWASQWPDVFEEWWTARKSPMAYAVRAYREAHGTGACTHTHRVDEHGDLHPLDEAFDRHIAAAGRNDVNLWDDDGQRLFVLAKIHPDRKFDTAMAGCLSWKAYLDGLNKGWNQTPKFVAPARLR